MYTLLSFFTVEVCSVFRSLLSIYLTGSRNLRAKRLKCRICSKIHGTFVQRFKGYHLLYIGGRKYRDLGYDTRALLLWSSIAPIWTSRSWNCFSFRQIFIGNVDTNSVVRNELKMPLRTRWLRIVPRSWNNHIGMRVELYGCWFNKRYVLACCQRISCCKNCKTRWGF